MATMKEIRKELVKLRKFLSSQKGGLSTQATEKEKAWYNYAKERSDKVREDINKVISMLDDVIGK